MDAREGRAVRGTGSERLVAGAIAAAKAAKNEANLRHEIELLLREECRAAGIPYAPYGLERPLRGDQKNIAFADVVHGGVIIEYEPPGSFSAGGARANVQHAKDQAEDYAARITQRRGEPIAEELEELDRLAVRIVSSHG